MSSNVHRAAATVVALAVLTGSGCSWFRKDNALYAQSPESRPLEVPPDLDAPRTDGAMALPPAGRAINAPAAAPAADAPGFTVAGTRDEVFAKVGGALDATAGVTVASRAPSLGAYDVAYEGANFLVRIAGTDSGAYVSAVDPRGLPATGEAPAKLIAALRAALAAP